MSARTKQPPKRWNSPTLMARSGYLPYIDPIDARVVKDDSACPCGGQYEYRGYRKAASYRAFRYCPKCGDFSEF